MRHYNGYSFANVSKSLRSTSSTMSILPAQLQVRKRV